MAHLALGQPVLQEHGLDGLQIVLGRQIHHGEKLVIELPVLVGGIAVALDQIVEEIAVGGHMPVQIHAHEAARAAGSPDRPAASCPDKAMAPG